LNLKVRVFIFKSFVVLTFPLIIVWIVLKQLGKHIYQLFETIFSDFPWNVWYEICETSRRVKFHLFDYKYELK